MCERGHVMYSGSTRGKWVAVGRGAFHRQWEDSLKTPLEELFNVQLSYTAVITLKCFLWENMYELESGVGSATPAHPAGGRGRGRQRHLLRLFMVITSSLRDGTVE